MPANLGLHRRTLLGGLVASTAQLLPAYRIEAQTTSSSREASAISGEIARLERTATERGIQLSSAVRAPRTSITQTNLYSASFPRLADLIYAAEAADIGIADEAAILLSRVNSLERTTPEAFSVRRAGPVPRFSTIRDEYTSRYRSLQISPSRRSLVRWHAQFISRNRPRYSSVGTPLAIPWYFIGLIHALEASFNFRAHLHNGDAPLGERTRQVPRGKPENWLPPSDWESSATDALTLLGFAHQADWSLARVLYRLEAYNGFGYRRRGVPSAYLWSFSSHYRAGKYIRDGVWSSTAKSQQCGAATIIRMLDEMKEISF